MRSGKGFPSYCKTLQTDEIFGIKLLIADAKRWVRVFSICWCIFFFTMCNQTPPLPGADSSSSESALPSIYTYTIVNTYLHDPNAFTQGLVFEDGFFYEGTGQYGASTIRRVMPATGAVLTQKSIASNFLARVSRFLATACINLRGNRVYALCTTRTHLSYRSNLLMLRRAGGLLTMAKS